MDKNITTPKISVVLPVYNGAVYLRSAIESVLTQTFPDFELVVINDGSTDNSLEIAKSFTDPRVRIINQENKGLIATLNIGISLSQAAYIARIDADDIWSDSNKLKKQFEYLEANPNCVLVGTWANVIDATGNNFSKFTYPFVTDKEIRSRLLTKNGFIHPSVLFRKEMCIAAGGFLENEKYVEDYGLWLRMGKLGTFANIPEHLISYRVHSESVTQRKNLEQNKNSLTLIQKHKNQYPGYFIAFLKWHLKILLRSY